MVARHTDQRQNCEVLRLDKTGDNLPDPAAYSALPAAPRLLDRIGTALYQDAVIPVALAHAFAAIPLRTGTRVLTLLSRDLLGRNA